MQIWVVGKLLKALKSKETTTSITINKNKDVQNDKTRCEQRKIKQRGLQSPIKGKVVNLFVNQASGNIHYINFKSHTRRSILFYSVYY